MKITSPSPTLQATLLSPGGSASHASMSGLRSCPGGERYHLFWPTIATRRNPVHHSKRRVQPDANRSATGSETQNLSLLRTLAAVRFNSLYAPGVLHSCQREVEDRTCHLAHPCRPVCVRRDPGLAGFNRQAEVDRELLQELRDFCSRPEATRRNTEQHVAPTDSLRSGASEAIAARVRCKQGGRYWRTECSVRYGTGGRNAAYVDRSKKRSILAPQVVV